MKKNIVYFLLISVAILILHKSVLAQQKTSLQQSYQNYFLIGTALNATQILSLDTKAATIINNDFGAVTPENIMKSEIIHPKWDQYDFSLADKMVEYAQAHHLKVNGHTLIWHSQLPPFMKHMQSADSVKRFFVNHIETVAKQYEGKVFSWDVVNEALEEDGSLRKSIFFEKLGPSYIADAFQLAQKATPKAELYYNDYNIEQPKKRAGAIAIIKELQAKGIRIDGVGIQGHWRYNKIPLKEIEESVIEFSSLGVKVMFTELDLGVLPNPWDSDAADVNMKATYSDKMNPFVNGLPDSVQLKFTEGYESLFKLFIKHKDKISRVTFWGVHDGQSWLNGWPIKGRTNYPLLFDRQYLPKEAYYKVIALTK